MLATNHLNNDKYLDLVVVNREIDNIGIFFGFDYTIFTEQKSCKSGQSSGPASVAIADFNNDDHLNIVAAFYNQNNIGVFLGYSNGSFTPIIMYLDVPSSRP